MHKHTADTLEPNTLKRQKRAPNEVPNKSDPPWHTLPSLPLTKIFEYIIPDNHYRKYKPNVSHFALTCKAFYQIYMDSFLYMFTEIRSLFAKRYSKSVGYQPALKRGFFSKVKELIAEYESELEATEALKMKRIEWNNFLSSKKMDAEASRLLSSQIFDMVAYKEVSVIKLDNGAQYAASVLIGKVKLYFSSYDEAGCEGNWALSLKYATVIELKRGSEVLLYYEKVLGKLRKRLKLTDTTLIPNELFIKALVHTLPWKFGSFFCFYMDIMAGENKWWHEENGTDDEN